MKKVSTDGFFDESEDLMIDLNLIFSEDQDDEKSDRLEQISNLLSLVLITLMIIAFALCKLNSDGMYCFHFDMSIIDSIMTVFFR